MLKRVLTAAVLIAFFIGVLYLRETSVIFLDVVIFLIMLGSMYELYKAFLNVGVKTDLIALSVYAVLYASCFYFFNFNNSLVWAISLALIYSLIAFTFSKDSTLAGLTATVFTMLYPGVLLYFALLSNHSQNGLLLIMLFVVVSVFTDTFAYFVGSTLKGKKLCPTISPKKTVSGAIGGLLGGIAGAVLVYFCFEKWMLFGEAYSSLGFSADNALIVYVALGVIGAIADELGDLFSSRIKRKTEIKDFGNIFPGHGGVLDRIDGLSTVAATLYVVISFLLWVSEL